MDVCVRLVQQGTQQVRTKKSCCAGEKNVARITRGTRTAGPRLNVGRQDGVGEHEIASARPVAILITALDESGKRLDRRIVVRRGERQLDRELVLDRRGELDGAERIQSQRRKRR